MKLSRFKAEQVHEYIDFDIRFNPDVNFIAGLNGSGKTTALNIIASMLAPSIEELSKIKFKVAELEIETDEGLRFSIRATQTSDTLEISTSETQNSKPITTNLQELQLSLDRSNTNKFRSFETFSFISELPSPMYLSLDRRFIKEVTPYDSSPLSLYAMFDEKKNKLEHNSDSSVKEALELISKKSAELKDKQTSEDRKLRDKIILDSFYVDHGTSFQMAMPDKNAPQELRRKQNTIKETLIGLDFKLEDFTSTFDTFFENLIALSKSVHKVLNFTTEERIANAKNSASAKKKGIESIPASRNKSTQSKEEKIENISLESSKILAQWFSNSHQMGRIDRLIFLIGEYEKAKTEIYQPLVKFVALVNLFLEQTDKKIKVNSRGEVKIFIAGNERPLTVLSSGERQILIMLAHLSLSSLLPKSGVFIVDEPELSLHIAWQDMFLEAVQAASPNLQIILATHSPAIIGGRNNYYIPLNGGI